MKEQTKNKLKNYGIAVPLVTYAAGRLLVEEIIPEKLGLRNAKSPAPQTSGLIESFEDFMARKASERQEGALGQAAVTSLAAGEQAAEVIHVDFAPSEPPTDTYPIAA